MSLNEVDDLSGGIREYCTPFADQERNIFKRITHTNTYDAGSGGCIDMNHTFSQKFTQICVDVAEPSSPVSGWKFKYKVYCTSGNLMVHPCWTADSYWYETLTFDTIISQPPGWIDLELDLKLISEAIGIPHFQSEMKVWIEFLSHDGYIFLDDLLNTTE
jgi:hypothetical protein